MQTFWFCCFRWQALSTRGHEGHPAELTMRETFVSFFSSSSSKALVFSCCCKNYWKQWHWLDLDCQFPRNHSCSLQHENLDWKMLVSSSLHLLSFLLLCLFDSCLSLPWKIFFLFNKIQEIKIFTPWILPSKMLFSCWFLLLAPFLHFPLFFLALPFSLVVSLFWVKLFFSLKLAFSFSVCCFGKRFVDQKILALWPNQNHDNDSSKNFICLVFERIRCYCREQWCCTITTNGLGLLVYRIFRISHSVLLPLQDIFYVCHWLKISTFFL